MDQQEPRRGRLTMLTPECQQKICDALRQGVDRTHASLSAGVSIRTFQRWLAEGRREYSEATISFLAAVKKAEADAVVALMEQIGEAAKNGDWTAAAWKLERRHPNKYGRERIRIAMLEKQVRQLAEALNGSSATQDQATRTPDEGPSAADAGE